MTLIHYKPLTSYSKSSPAELCVDSSAFGKVEGTGHSLPKRLSDGWLQGAKSFLLYIFRGGGGGERG